MKWDELSNFTWDELSYFTWADLTLGKLELLEKINQDEQIPAEIANKLYQLCNDIMKEFPSANISVPTDKMKLTLKDTNEILKFIINLFSVYKLIPEPIRQMVDRFIEVLLNLFIK